MIKTLHMDSFRLTFILYTCLIQIKENLVNLHNYCSDDCSMNMKSCILYMVYSTRLALIYEGFTLKQGGV